MQCTIGWANHQRQWGAVAHTMAVLGLVALTAVGVSLESSGGWVACPPLLVGIGNEQRRRRRRRHRHYRFAWRVGWVWLRRSWMVTAVRSEALMLLVFLTGCREWEWVCLLPWAVWLWKGWGAVWPGLGRRPLYRGVGRLMEEVGRLAFVGLGLMWLAQHISILGEQSRCALSAGKLSQWVEVSVPHIEVERDEAGTYHVRISGEFEIHVDGNVEMYERMLVIFLGLLEVPGEKRCSRRTRDGRTPFVRQEQMAEWFEVPQPHISLWFKYWLERDWRRMLSQKWGEVRC